MLERWIVSCFPPPYAPSPHPLPLGGEGKGEGEILVIEIWLLFGNWCLEFEIFLAHLPPSFSNILF